MKATMELAASWSDSAYSSSSAAAAASASSSSASTSTSSSAASAASDAHTLSSFSWWSLLHFGWVGSLLRAGQARGYLELHEDFMPLVGRDDTARWEKQFAQTWAAECERVQKENQRRQQSSNSSNNRRTISSPPPQLLEPSMLRALWRCFGWRFMAQGLLKLTSDCLVFSGPVLLGYLVSFVESYHSAPASASDGSTPATTSPEQPWHGYLYASGLVLGVLLNALFASQYNFRIRRVGLHLRSCVVTAVYAQSLGLSPGARTAFSSGQITNLMSTDTERLMDLTVSVHELWSLPVQVALALWLLFREVGWALLAGLGVVLLLIPVNAAITRRISRVSRDIMAAKDQRLSLINELLANIRPIKLLAIEHSFTRRIEAIREKELNQLKKRKYLDALCVYFCKSRAQTHNRSIC